MRKVMIFGVFDGVHDGHRAFLREAKSHGDYLIVVLAQDHIVKRLKGHLPEINLAERLVHLQKEDGVNDIVIGDAELGVWEVIKKYQPHIVAIGHDQQSLKESIEKYCVAGALPFCPALKVMAYYERNKV